MSDPQPLINPYRVVFFLSTVLAALLALDTVPAEIKTWLVIALLVINAVLTVFFSVPVSATGNRSIAQRVTGRGK